MNRKLSDVIGIRNYIEFYVKSLELAKKYQFLVKFDEFIYHRDHKQAGFMVGDTFYHVCCPSASIHKPQECSCFQFNIDAAYRHASELKNGPDFVKNL